MTGLILDELALLLGRDSPCWAGERIALVQGAAAGGGAIALAARFHSKGSFSSSLDHGSKAKEPPV